MISEVNYRYWGRHFISFVRTSYPDLSFAISNHYSS